MFLSAQDQTNSVWNFGNKCRLKFPNGSVSSLETEIFAHEGVSSLCDENGNLLLFTDGQQVWRGDNTSLLSFPNTLRGGSSSTQAALIIPYPKHKDKYFIFTTGMEAGFTWFVDTNYIGLAVSLLDMNANNGAGQFEYMNTVLLDQACEKLTAVRACGLDEHWIIGHDWNSSNFYAWKLTENGLSQPVISNVGSFIPSLFDSSGVEAIGQLKSSFDGKKVVSVLSQNSRIELFDFDINTGILSNAIVDTLLNRPYGASFSPDNSKLYITDNDYSGEPDTKQSTIFQYNALANSEEEFQLSKTVVSIVDRYTGAIEAGPDGKLYIANPGKTTLSRINQPNEIAQLCQFTNQAVFLAEPCICSFGLQNVSYIPSPNLPDFLFTTDTVKSCDESINLEFQALQGSYLWNSGDTASFITVNETGIYTLSYQIDCNYRVDSIYADFNHRIDFSLPNDTILCNKLEFTISPMFTPQNSTVILSGAEALLPITIDSSGKYYLEINNSYCSFLDSIEVEFIQLEKPFLGNDKVLCNVDEFVLSFEAPEVEYLWSNGSSDSAISVSESGDYWLQISKMTCTEADTINIQKYIEASVQFPNVNTFSPNGDLINDEFIIGNETLKDYSFSVFNKWGLEVFNSNSVLTKWNGSFNGQNAPDGHYLWRCVYTDPCMQTKVDKKGTVLLIR